jgi:ribonuclease VapC
MVVDTSALMAILLKENEADPFARAVAADPRRLISVFNWLEAAIVIEAKKGEAGGRELDLLLHRAQIETIAMNPDQAEIARRAWRLYGTFGEPLLFKGRDF